MGPLVRKPGAFTISVNEVVVVIKGMAVAWERSIVGKRIRVRDSIFGVVACQALAIEWESRLFERDFWDSEIEFWTLDIDW